MSNNALLNSATGGGGGGTGGDMLAQLLSSEVSITGATTLDSSAFGKMHVCSGTSADYTLGLPAVSGNAGKFIGFRMAAGLTKLITLDANSSETIDGATTRVMWAQESAILLCDGTAWVKIAGKQVPAYARARYSTGSVSRASYTGGTANIIGVTVAESDPRSYFSSADSALKIRRPGTYLVWSNPTAGDDLTAGSFWEVSIAINGAIYTADTGGTTVFPAVALGASVIMVGTHTASLSLAIGDLVKICCYAGESKSSRQYDGSEPRLTIQEVPSW